MTDTPNKRTAATVSTKSVHAEFPVLKAQESRQEPDAFAGKTFATGGAENTLIEPAYPPQVLNSYVIASGVLRTCVEAMATNIDGFGYTLEYVGPEGEREGAAAQEEHTRVDGVLSHPNGEYSFTDLRKRFRTDREATGYAAMEIVRNEDDGFPDMLFHVPSHTVRLTSQDHDPTEVQRYLPRPGAKQDNMIKTRKRFRRVVQIVNGKPVYFKEPGDPRDIDRNTGKQSDAAMAEDKDATEILLDALYAPGGRYGTPRWVGDLRSVLGLQESENLNLGYFKDNGIPAMMIFVLGGAMTEEGMNSFEQGVRQNRGQAMQQKVALIEVEGDAKAASEEGIINRPDVKVQALAGDRQSDAFFQEFERNASKKIRSAFRMPAMFTGLTEEVRMAVAAASITIAENQVFGPERTQTDDLLNFQVLTYGNQPMKYWRVRSNPPRITSDEAVLEALSTFDDVGAMTPNVAIGIANEMFGMNIPPIAETWGDVPFKLTQAVQDAPKPNGEGETPSDEEPHKKEIRVRVRAKPVPRRRRATIKEKERVARAMGAQSIQASNDPKTVASDEDQEDDTGN